MRPLFFINPESHSVRTKGSVLEKAAKASDVQLVKLTDFSVLPDLVSRAAKEECEWVFIEGGDGTAHGVLTHFMREAEQFKRFPKFSILPGGMTNQVARNIGMKRTIPSAISDLISKGPSAEKTVPIVHLEIQGAPSQYGFVFSSGGIPSATDYCTSKMYDRGLGGGMAVAATIARGVAGSQKIRDEMMPPTPIDLTVANKGGNEHIKEDHLATLVTTLPGLILKIDPFWGKETAPLRLTYAKADAQHLVRNLFSLWAGRKHVDRTPDGLKSFNAAQIDYVYGGPVVLDGEKITLPEDRVSVKSSPPITFAS